jgi:hypothetical protein
MPETKWCKVTLYRSKGKETLDWWPFQRSWTRSKGGSLKEEKVQSFLLPRRFPLERARVVVTGTIPGSAESFSVPTDTAKLGWNGMKTLHATFSW